MSNINLPPSPIKPTTHRCIAATNKAYNFMSFIFKSVDTLEIYKMSYKIWFGFILDLPLLQFLLHFGRTPAWLTYTSPCKPIWEISAKHRHVLKAPTHCSSVGNYKVYVSSNKCFDILCLVFINQLLLPSGVLSPFCARCTIFVNLRIFCVILLLLRVCVRGFLTHPGSFGFASSAMRRQSSKIFYLATSRLYYI